MSDLHLEHQWAEDLALPAADDYDVVILAGDIGSHTHGVEWAARTFSKHIVYVAGNHEFWDAQLPSMRGQLKKAAARHPHVHVLDNSQAVLGDPTVNCTEQVRFLGCTLWTNYKLFGDTLPQIRLQMWEGKQFMTDYSVTRTTGGLWLTPADTAGLFRESAAWLADELRKPFDGKTVVVTHHLPSKRSVPPAYQHDLFTAAFASHLDHLVRQVDVWVHGHTHAAFDYRIGKCRVICHPRGYPNERRDRQPYKPMIVEV